MPLRSRRALRSGRVSRTWRARARRGVYTLWTILFLPALLLMFVFLVDIAQLWLARVELENALEHAFVLCQGPQIKLEHLPELLVEKARERKYSDTTPSTFLEAAEKQALQRALENGGGKRKKAAATSWR